MFGLFGNYKVRRFFNNNNHKYKIIGKLNEAYSEFYQIEAKPRKVCIKLGDKEEHFVKLLSSIRKNSSKKMNKESVMKYNSDCRNLYELYEKLNESAKKKHKDAASCVNISAVVRMYDLIRKSGKEIDESELRQLITADLNDAEGKEAKEFLKSNLEFVEGKRKSLPGLKI